MTNIVNKIKNNLSVKKHNNHILKVEENNIRCINCNEIIFQFEPTTPELQLLETGITYDNLSKKAKENVLEYFRNSYDNIDWDLITENFESIMEENGFNDLKFEWNLSYDQGDFVRFAGNIYLKDILKLKDINITKKQKKQINTLLKFTTRKNLSDYLYVVENVGNVSFYTSVVDTDNKHIDKLLNDINELLENWITNKLKELKKNGYNQIDNISEEYIKETIDANEYLFDINGNLM